MEDVLLLLAVTERLVELTDEQGGSRRHDLDRGLAVLDRQLDGHTQT